MATTVEKLYHRSMKGVELRRIRKRLRLTQVELAALVGVTPTTVARWERGERRISESIARLVKLTAGELVKTVRKQRK